MLYLNKRRVKLTDESFSFLTPDSWRVDPAIQKEYDRVHFNRDASEMLRITCLVLVTSYSMQLDHKL
jgi:hypothetical protein